MPSLKKDCWHNFRAKFDDQPNRPRHFRIFVLLFSPSCAYSENDTQSIGKFQAYLSKNETAVWKVHGSEQFSQIGWSVSMGNPYIDQSKTVIAVSALGQDVNGSIAGYPFMIPQAGQVMLYSVTDSGELVPEKYLLQGDRRFGRYGFKVKVNLPCSWH